jgi:hypothetical protein
MKVAVAMALAAAPLLAVAQYGEPRFAINEFRAVGQKSTVKSATVSLLPVRSRASCELTLKAFRESAALQPTITIDKQLCATQLPGELAGIADSAPLPGAVYIRYSYTSVGLRNVGWDITWLGAAGPGDFCARALVRYKAKYEEAICVAPA